MELAYLPMLQALTSNNIPELGKLVVKIPELQQLYQDEVMQTVKTELIHLSSRETNSYLRDHAGIKSFSLSNVIEEWKEKTPTFLKMLDTCISNPSHNRNKFKKDDALLPGLVSAGCKLLSIFNKDMNVFQHLNSLVLWKGGCKKSAFSRLNATFDCLSYQATLNLADKLGKDWDKDILLWQEQVTTDAARELSLLHEKNNIKESLDLLDGDPERMVSLILELSDVETALENHRECMNPGYYFVGDNVDMRTKVRNMTMANQHKDHHMYQICAYQNRISGNHLDNTVPKADINKVPFSTFLPDEMDSEKLASEFTHRVAKMWCQFIPHFNIYSPGLPPYIEHPYMNEVKQKSKRVSPLC